MAAHTRLHRRGIAGAGGRWSALKTIHQLRRFHFGATSGSLVDPPLLGPFQNVSPTLTRAMKPPHSLMVCDPFRAREVSHERHMRASRSQEANRVELEASGGGSEVSHSRTDRKKTRTQRGYCAGMKSIGFSTPVHQKRVSPTY